MLKFPTVSAHPEPPLPKMSLLEYAEFSLECLKSNPTITPENCLHKRTDEATMQPFRLKTDDQRPKTEN